MGADVTDLHTWITQQVEQRQREAHEGRLLLDEEGRYLQHAPVDDPAAVLRRCEADRRILARHRIDPDEAVFPGACKGCGVDDWGLPNIDSVNDCHELLDLAHAHGITDEILASLDRPEMPPRPAPKPLGGVLPPGVGATADVPPTLRGPNWKGTTA